MVFQAEDRTRAKRQHANAAIQMALQGQWEQAVDLNRSILESFPADVDACNRLGKALTELGRYADARDSYMKAIEIDPLNLIASKNLGRLATLGKTAPKRKRNAVNQKLSPEMFIEESGKTITTELLQPDLDVANHLTAGDVVNLAQDKKGNLSAETMAGERFGDIETRLAQRLVKLMDSGNQYFAAISSLREDGVKLFIRETLQDVSQVGKLSFPATVTESVRPYTKARLVRSDGDDPPPDDADDSAAGGDDSDEDDGKIAARARGKLPGADGDDEDDEDDEDDD